jgi:hypothetical protein
MTGPGGQGARFARFICPQNCISSHLKDPSRDLPKLDQQNSSMRLITTTFGFSSLLALISLVVLIMNWQAEERWRFVFSLIGFSIFFIMACVVGYVRFWRRP